MLISTAPPSRGAVFVASGRPTRAICGRMTRQEERPHETLRRPRQSRRANTPVNRHNIGFMAVDRIAEEHGLRPVEGAVPGQDRRRAARRRQGAAAEARDLHEPLGPVRRARRCGSSSWSPRMSASFTTSSTSRPARLKVKMGGGHAGPQRAALDPRAYRRGLPAGAARHRPSRPQGRGVGLRAARLRQGRAGLARRRAARHRGRRAGARRRRSGRLHEQGEPAHGSGPQFQERRRRPCPEREDIRRRLQPETDDRSPLQKLADRFR